MIHLTHIESTGDRPDTQRVYLLRDGGQTAVIGYADLKVLRDAIDREIKAIEKEQS